MSDCISRKAAVDALTKVALRVADSKRRTVATCINEIELLPTANVEPVRHGYWIYQPSTTTALNTFKCSRCGWWTTDYAVAGKCRCPNCKASMYLEGSNG